MRRLRDAAADDRRSFTKQSTVRIVAAAAIGVILFGQRSCSAAPPDGPAPGPREVSGIYPHLAMFNEENECGIGAVVPWADRLWAITYAPHRPNGSTDKLYEIDDALNIVVRSESVGGTPAARMVHRESNQLFLGPYAIDASGSVRVIDPQNMPGRLTGVARHLFEPASKVYYATMEEGFYEVDVDSLEVKELYPDANHLIDHAGELLPGYHGKGLFSSQGRLVYANNGELSQLAQSRPDIESGCLAEWDGQQWRVVRRHQFTEVTGPGGICGNALVSDPIWSIGWDHKSLLLAVLDAGTWHTYRLPKGSHCYDGAHGWNTEWPRIRDIGEDDLLMTMHGLLWRFPRGFSTNSSGGIRTRSAYLKVVGDFCRWHDRIVFACDDAAKNDFLNKRKAKGTLAGPGQSQSNLWFVTPDRLDQLGPIVARGAVWLEEPVQAGELSDPFLFAGFERRGILISHHDDSPATFMIEFDVEGTGDWVPNGSIQVPGHGECAFLQFTPSIRAEWIRVRATRDLPGVTVIFHCGSDDVRSPAADHIFDGLARFEDAAYSAGIIRARGANRRTLHFAATTVEDHKIVSEGYYELDGKLNLVPVSDRTAHDWLKLHAAVPENVITADAASVLYVDEEGRRFRLPRGSDVTIGEQLIPVRIDREVCTERDLFNCGGIFYELPANNAGGFTKIRPITTHNRRITDYCSYRGMLVMTGVARQGAGNNGHIVRSSDGKCAVWVGAVDDLWRMGKPVGQGGPWQESSVRAGEPSDPYLMTGFDKKLLTVTHDLRESINVHVELDAAGTGDWHRFVTLTVAPGDLYDYRFPAAVQAYWVRFVTDKDANVTAHLMYE